MALDGKLLPWQTKKLVEFIFHVYFPDSNSQGSEKDNSTFWTFPFQ